MLKPDAVPRRKVGEILQKFQRVGLNLLNMEMAKPTKELIYEHYAEHKGKPFYEGLCEYVLSGPVIKLLIGGEMAISRGRKIIKQVRQELCIGGRMNLIHGSDSEESAKREIDLWFGNGPKAESAETEEIQKEVEKVE